MAGSLFLKKETLVQVFSCEFYKISKNTFFHRTPLVAAFESRVLLILSSVNEALNDSYKKHFQKL